MNPLAVTWQFPETLILIGITLVVAAIVTWLLRRSVTVVTNRALELAERNAEGRASRADQLLAQASGMTKERYAKRAATISSLLHSMITVVMSTLTVLTVLSILDVPLLPILTSAGVGGVALAFGAQSLVKDYISGVFMIIEDQYGVGDTIDTGVVAGTVEEVNLRVTKLRDDTGQIWYVRNGEITRIGNRTQGWSTANVDIQVAASSDPQAVLDVLRGLVDAMDVDPAWDHVLLEKPNVAGVDSVIGGTMTVKIFAKTEPGKGPMVQREILERAVPALAQAGIQRPSVFPQAAAPE
ncbi:MAG: mechanosensitive ion channel family protein [Propionibacteriaceae bacterium]|nr:mechanosensitive ion channel family protein [Micropruina sp.]HBY22442.1 mechanosensitive ion channel family protein [Propionibacteriaceae bacterium]